MGSGVLDVLQEGFAGHWSDWESAVDVSVRRKLVRVMDLVRFDLGDCKHGYDIRTMVEDGEHSWFLNTYICPDNLRVEEGVFLLGGFHDLPLEWPARRHPFDPDRPDFTYCVTWAWSPLGVLFRW